MKQVLFAMEFKGKGGTPADGSGKRFRLASRAPSCTITTAASPDGVGYKIQPTGTGGASFESLLTLTGEGTFTESGSIAFGENNHKLRFSTVGEGWIGAAAEPGTRHGAANFRVEGGEGQFEGASGLITSNFVIDPGGDFVDYLLGVISLR